MTSSCCKRSTCFLFPTHCEDFCLCCRFFQPRGQISSTTWKFVLAQPVNICLVVLHVKKRKKHHHFVPIFPLCHNDTLSTTYNYKKNHLILANRISLPTINPPISFILLPSDSFPAFKLKKKSNLNIHPKIINVILLTS